MRGEQLAYAFAAVCAFIAAAVFILGRIRVRRALEKVRGAEQALALLADIAPAFTDAAADSASRTCERIIQRFGALVRAQTTLCIVASNGRLLLGAKSDSGYADFLKPGDPCDGDSIVDWVADHALPAIIGPNVAGANSFAPNVAGANSFTPRFGFINAFKPPGLSSAALGNWVRRLTGGAPVGHWGTLDPLACGVLLLGVGKAARLFPLITDSRKCYVFELVVGERTDSGDACGTVIAKADIPKDWKRRLPRVR